MCLWPRRLRLCNFIFCSKRLSLGNYWRALSLSFIPREPLFFFQITHVPIWFSIFVFYPRLFFSPFTKISACTRCEIWQMSGVVLSLAVGKDLRSKFYFGCVDFLVLLARVYYLLTGCQLSENIGDPH